MRFYIFTIWEIIYKKVITVLVAGITIWSVYWYLNLKDKSDTFVVSTVYALFLFIIGIYINTIDKKINDKFYDRKEYYLSLIKLNSVFKTFDLENYSDDNILQSIINFQGFTSRSSELKKYPPYIPIKGFKFKDEELNVENEFIEKRRSLITTLHKNIMDYIDNNSIEKKMSLPSYR